MELLLILIITGVIALQTSFLTVREIKRHPVLASKKRIICDTSVLIDGRIIPIMQNGFMAEQLVIPRSVVRELQLLADKADHDKRERARYGLDVVAELQALDPSGVVIFDDGETHTEGVDEQLIVLAKQMNARLCTIDFNLNKVARTEKIPVININDLAHALRPMHLPGEMISVEVVSAGQNKNQGVGYLDDGTMVVIDEARKMQGKTVSAEVVRMLQTEAGRMVFATLTGDSSRRPRRQRGVNR